MTRLLRATAPTLVILIAGAILLTVAGLGSETLIVARAALRAALTVTHTIAVGLGYISIVSLGALIGLARAERRAA